jgi:hypothetical protein
MHGGGVDGGVSGEVELLEPFRSGEPGGGESPGGAAAGAVVAFGHHQFGEELEIGQLLALGGGGDLAEPGPHRRQPQGAATGFDRRSGGRLGWLTLAGHHRLLFLIIVSG